MLDLPINKAQAKVASEWLRKHYEYQLQEAVAGTRWDVEILLAIACNETAMRWLLWIENYEPSTILGCCVFDASGEPEFERNPRRAFPQNRDVFREHYGPDFLNMLVAEGNKQRGMPQWGSPNGYHPASYLFKAYGIFAFDLQNIVTDRAFFEQKQWYSIEECLKRVVQELNAKEITAKHLYDSSSLWHIVALYNGTGAKAKNYANNVMQYVEWV